MTKHRSILLGLLSTLALSAGCASSGLPRTGAVLTQGSLKALVPAIPDDWREPCDAPKVEPLRTVAQADQKVVDYEVKLGQCDARRGFMVNTLDGIRETLVELDGQLPKAPRRGPAWQFWKD